MKSCERRGTNPQRIGPRGGTDGTRTPISGVTGRRVNRLHHGSRLLARHIVAQLRQGVKSLLKLPSEASVVEGTGLEPVASCL